jgi:lipoprotein-releasing system ATP-binding protein
VLEITELTKSYPAPQGSLPVLQGITLSFSPGDVVSIMGPSGSGKSTFLYIVGTLETPTSGNVTIAGKNPFALDSQELATFRNESIGFVFQDHHLLPQCSVLENVLTPTLVAPSGESYEQRGRELLERVGMTDRIHHRPSELSGGEKQRAAVARALIREPTLLLCDEPTGNLDRHSSDSVASLLLDEKVRGERILIVVTHNAELASRFPVKLELTDGKLTQA